MNEIKEIICVELDNDFNDEYKYKALMGFNKESYILFCSACRDEKYEIILSNKKQILSDTYKSSKELVKENCIPANDNIKTMDWVYSSIETLKDSIKTVNIKGNLDDICYFVKHNAILKDKELIIGNNLPLTMEVFDKLNDYFGKYDNVLYKIEGNFLPITIEEYRATLIYINNIINMVEKHDYSPLEKLIYVYDIIRSREYNEVDTKEKYYYSRDLTSACLGDYIVCVGFSNIVREILNKLGIPTINLYLNSKINEPSHVRNLVYLNDSIYNINGFYELDVTFGCKKINRKYLLNYRYFLKTPSEMAKSDKENNYDNSFKFIDEKALNDYQQFLKDNILTDNIREIKDSIAEFYMMKEKRILVSKYLDENKFNYYDLLLNYYNLLNRPIDNRTFFDALLRVRNNIFYQDNNQSFGLTELYSILKYSNFKFDNDNSVEQVDDNYIKSWLEKYRTSNGLANRIPVVKLTRGLKE